MQVRRTLHARPAWRFGLPALLLIAAGIAVWAGWFRPGADAWQRAGSAAYVSPIAPLRLVSVMRPDRVDAMTESLVPGNQIYTDAEIQVAIAGKLEEMNLPVKPIQIHVKDRQVSLDGRVADSLLRDAIEITVRSVPGVRTVDNHLEVLNAAR